MAAENHASYSKIGFIVVAGVIAIFGALIWIGGLGGDRNVILAETSYEKPVSGLSVGSPVNFRGVNVGVVRDITFVGTVYHDAPEEVGDNILVVIAFDIPKLGLVNETPESEMRRLIARGMHATVSASGVTGLSKIELDFVNPIPPHRQLQWHPRHVYIPSAPSLFDNVAYSATRIMSELNHLDLRAGWTNVVRIVESAASVAAKVDAVDASAMTRILANVEEASAELKAAVKEIRANPARLLGSPNPEPLPETR